MKMTPEHFQILQKLIKKTINKYPGVKEFYETGQFINSIKTNDLQKRFCFDLFHAAIQNTQLMQDLYAYLNDEHIYTALKKICPVVERKY